LQLHAAGLLDHESGGLTNPWLAAALLVAVGALQFTPLKRACRERPLEGSINGGLRAAAVSMASCGALMLVPFATGMGLLPMVLVTALLVAERLAPRQWPVSSLAGALLAGAGVWLTFQSA
jgi:predicted metal-binding membrane protein